jgi:hypothetical protein
LRRPGSGNRDTKLATFASRLVENQTVKISIGDFKDIVATYARRQLRIELIEVPDDTKALLDIDGGSVLAWGSRVECAGSRFWIPRQTWPSIGRESVYYWAVAEGYFDFFTLSVEHINPHTKEVWVRISFFNASPSEPEPH